MTIQADIETALRRKHEVGDWHWLQWHFNARSALYETILDALVTCEENADQSGISIARDIGNLASDKRNADHYDEMLQSMSEVLIMNALSRSETFAQLDWRHERSPEGTNLCVDFVGEGAVGTFGVEVKAPAKCQLAPTREAHLQMVARLPDGSELAHAIGATLPRDNAVKDFLISANNKFARFKACNPDFKGMLIIVWDDFVHEPMSFLHGPQGLLTKNSFYRDGYDNPVAFDHIGAVIVLRHLSYFSTALATDDAYAAYPELFHVGAWEGLPNIVFPLGPKHQDAPAIAAARSCFDAVPFDDPVVANGADYRPQELVLWLDRYNDR